MTISNRTFGVEIEFVGNRSAAVRALQNAGIECTLEGYNHYTRSTWKCVHDGSVANGGEIVSPILRGEEGIATLKTVLRTLSAGSFRISRDCGIHVHVGARDLSVDQIRTIVKRYAHNESVIDSMMPRSRRESNNTYCQSLSGVVGGRMDRASSNEALQSAMNYDRYFKVNLMSIARHGTIEFRQHSGSLNASKVSNWVKFCLNFVETTISMMRVIDQNAATTYEPNPAGSTVSTGRSYRRNSKAGRILTLLGTSADGYTANQIAERVSSTRTSVMTMISNMRRDGHTITRRNSRYYLSTVTPAAAPAATTTGSTTFPRQLGSVSTGRANSARRAFFEYIAYSNHRDDVGVRFVNASTIRDWMQEQGRTRVPTWTRMSQVRSEVLRELSYNVTVGTVRDALRVAGVAVTAGTTSSAPRTRSGDYSSVITTDCFQGLDSQVVNYFQERIQDFAS